MSAAAAPARLAEAVPYRVAGAAGVLVRLEDGDAAGWGEAPLPPGRSLEDLLAELREGRPVSASARCAWETAALDLRGRRSGAGVAELLGGARRTSVEAAARVGEARPAAVAVAVERLAAAGFRVFSLTTVDLGGELDLARLGAARWAAGARSRLRLDFAGRLPEARGGAVMRTLAGFGLELVRQPVPARASLAAWEAVRRLGVRVAAGESLAESAPAAALAAAGFALAIDPAVVGGPVRAVQLAAAGGGAFASAGAGAGIAAAAAVHAACAFEADPPACEIEAGPGGGVAGGRVQLPGGPGLGVEPDPRWLAAYRVDR